VQELRRLVEIAGVQSLVMHEFVDWFR